MKVNILLDKVTKCLEDQDENMYATVYRLRKTPIRKSEYKGWEFDWSKEKLPLSDVYEILLKDDSIVQGRIALHPEGGVIFVDLIESAPWNVGSKKGYNGVGFHLFALACKISMDLGYEGYVGFDPKTDLRDYYIDTIGAVHTVGNLLGIFPDRAIYLIKTYFETCEVIDDE